MLQLCKLALCAYSLNALAYIIPQRLPRYGVLFVIALLSSSVASSFLFAPYRAQLQQAIESKMNSPIHGKIQELMLVHGINRIYGGDFWSTLRLEVNIPPAKAAVLSVSKGNINFFQWLTRPSMRCIAGNVFYILDRSKVNEEFIARRVLEKGGRILERFGDTGIYLGAPVWDQSGALFHVSKSCPIQTHSIPLASSIQPRMSWWRKRVNPVRLCLAPMSSSLPVTIRRPFSSLQKRALMEPMSVSWT